jgi:hypothetical protein
LATCGSGEREREKREVGGRVQSSEGQGTFILTGSFLRLVECGPCPPRGGRCGRSGTAKPDAVICRQKLEMLAGRIGLRNGVLFPLARNQERRRPLGNPANCHAPLRHRKTGSRPDQASYFSHMESLDLEEAALLTDVCIAITLTGSQHVNCRRVGPKHSKLCI